MLNEIRDIVCSMWEAAEGLEGLGLSKMIPHIAGRMDIRHAMKAEAIQTIFEVEGYKEELTDEQVEYLQFVLHAPIKKGDTASYVNSIKDWDFIRDNPLMAYMALYDMEMGKHKGKTTLSEIYLKFLSTMVAGYLALGKVDEIGVILRYYDIMQRNIDMIKKCVEGDLNYDCMGIVDDENREKIEKLCQFLNRLAPKNEVLEENMQLLEEVAKCDDLAKLDEKAKEKYGDFRAGVRRVKEKLELGNIIKATDAEVNVKDFDDKPEDEEDAQDQLDSMIGLAEVKQQVRSVINYVKIRQECEKRGVKRQPMSYHMVFTGNPGTGKTTVARIIAEIYHDMGVLSKGHLVEVGRADLVAGYVGQTAIKTQEVIKKAKGGVLFIDEAYSLMGSGNDFGREAVETLLKGMEDNRNDLIVIVAGYPALMKQFMESNPGLASRFSKTIYFPDYSAGDLVKIFQKFCKDNNLKLEKEALAIVKTTMETEVACKKKDFGNARMVRNYFEQAMMNQANRLSGEANITDKMLCKLTKEDVPMKIRLEKKDLFVL